MLIKEFTYDNSSIFYRIYGRGKPVLLLHGFGEEGDIWQNQIESLKKEYQLFIPDLPGSGHSQMISDMSIDGMAECIVYLIKHEILKAFEQANVILLGHSMGAYIMLAIAEKYPELLHSVGLIHSSAFADSEEKKIARAKSIQFMKEHGAYAFLKTSIPGLFWDKARREKREAVEDLVEKGRSFTSEALVAYYIAMINRPDRTGVLKNFHGPVLLIIGQHDVAVPFEQGLQQTHMASHTHLHIMRDSGHMSMVEETDKLNMALLEFLDK